MDSQRLGEFQKKASGFLGEGMRILKDGLKEAGRLINVTADAAKLHIEKDQRIIDTHRDYHRLGEEMYHAVQQNPNLTEVKLSGVMRNVIRRIQQAEKEIKQRQKRLSHMTVVSVPVRRRAASRRSKTSQRTGAGRGGAIPRRPRHTKRTTSKKKR